MTSIKHPQKNESELVRRAQAGCSTSTDQLVRAYERITQRMAARFFLPGGESSDLRQEALLGLATALKTYNRSYEVSFHDYALMCIRNSLVRAIRSATRKKHQMLNQASDLSALPGISKEPGVDQQVMNRLTLKDLWAHLERALSPLELEILRKRVAGKCAEEIAEEMKISVKQVENGLFRARTKARELTREEPAARKGRRSLSQRRHAVA